MAVILIIDDDVQICETMQRMVARAGHSGLAASTLANGLALLRTTPVDIVFLDVRLPDGDGLEALPAILDAPSRPEVIVLTGQGTVDGAATAIHGGVWDYLVKPMSLQETLQRLERALAYRESKHAKEMAPLCLDNVVGVSPGFRACLDLVGKAARSEAPVLLVGETGTGKELMARTIHCNSQRRDKPFVVVDCAALSETLLESLLFGHKKGSFTSAHADSLGLIRAADQGVLFLDEIGELSLNAQKTFLRVLQEKRFRPVGEIREFASDFRLVAATNRNLDTMIEDGSFRSDLFFRLRTMEIHLPPLRQRPQDITLLAMYRVGALAQAYGMPRKSLDPEFLEHLRLYQWPGNVRELFAMMETAFVAGWDSDVLYPRHLPSALRIAVARRKLERDGNGHAPAGAPPPAAAPDASSPAGTTPQPPTSLPVTTAPHLAPPPGATAPRPLPSASLPAPCLPLAGTDDDFPSLKAFKASMEGVYLEALHQRTQGDVDRMTAISGLSKSHLYALLKKHHPAR
ncbi:MAG: sigma-54 dependent transcriptional regulator [Desulfovibrio sp.]|nr:sigma-54 dependent transcriptional regulator [Desulfovibrio sp.]MCA1985737.1 sigma-54 dependent transcriptional regulator [Desulfovibrio sp.]